MLARVGWFLHRRPLHLALSSAYSWYKPSPTKFFFTHTSSFPTLAFISLNCCYKYLMLNHWWLKSLWNSNLLFVICVIADAFFLRRPSDAWQRGRKDYTFILVEDGNGTTTPYLGLAVCFTVHCLIHEGLFYYFLCANQWRDWVIA